MILGRYKQRPYDKRKRGIDYTDFLISGETIAEIVSVTIAPTTTTPFVVDQMTIDPAGLLIAYYAGGGESPNEYSAKIRVRTSLNQYREDEVFFEVEDEA